MAFGCFSSYIYGLITNEVFVVFFFIAHISIHKDAHCDVEAVHAKY
jgi:hypothetical protein